MCCRRSWRCSSAQPRQRCRIAANSERPGRRRASSLLLARPAHVCCLLVRGAADGALSESVTRIEPTSLMLRYGTRSDRTRMKFHKLLQKRMLPPAEQRPGCKGN
eukprot:7387887-Prymnesium_polylepis.1